MGDITLTGIWRSTPNGKDEIKKLIRDPLRWAVDELKKAKKSENLAHVDTAIEILDFVVKGYAPDE